MHSAAYIALPGGFGTLDELFEVLTLVQTRTVPPAPIVLIGTEFWSGLIDWIKVQLLKQRLIGPHDLELITINDDLDVVMQDIEELCRHYPDERDAAPALPDSATGPQRPDCGTNKNNYTPPYTSHHY